MSSASQPTSASAHPLPGNARLVSAIVSTYKSQRFIEACFEDLTAQTLFQQGRLEIVVIDSCSPENEREIVERYQRQHANIVYVRTDERETLYAAWNRGVGIARGEYLTNANTDDRHAPDGLERLANALDVNPTASLAYGDCYLSTVPNEPFLANSGARRYCYPDFFAPAALLHYQFGPQPMWRRTIHADMGLFDGAMRAAGDYDFNLRFAQKFRAIHVPEILGSYLAHEGAISFADSSMAKETQMMADRYQNDAVIEALYRNEGVATDTPAAKAAIQLDLGMRALSFFPPWQEGASQCNAMLALKCFTRARELDSTQVAAANNLFCLLILLKKTDLAIAVARNAGPLMQHPTFRRNIQEGRSGAAKTNPQLQFLPSPLGLRSQRDLVAETATARVAAV